MRRQPVDLGDKAHATSGMFKRWVVHCLLIVPHSRSPLTKFQTVSLRLSLLIEFL